MAEESLLDNAEPVKEEVEQEEVTTTEQETTKEEVSESSEVKEGDVDKDAIFDKMIPHFKELNLDEQTSREMLDRMISGKDIGDLADDQGLIFGKYKDAVAAQEAFKNLESENGRLRREKSPEAPENYEYNAISEDEEIKSIIPEDYKVEDEPIVQYMEPIFKDAGLDQEKVDSIIKGYLKYEAETAPNPAKEKEALGADANRLISEAASFRDMAEFSEEERAIINSWSRSADEVKLLSKIRKLTSAPKTIPSGEDIKAPRVSSAELYVKAKEIRNKKGFEASSDLQKLYDQVLDEAISAEEREKGR